VYVTHNLSEAFIMSDRIAIMGNGRIEQIGIGAELFDKPTSNYVAQFLGVNTFKGEAVKTRDEFLEFEAKGVLLLAPFAPGLIGKKVVATVNPEYITLSKSRDSTAGCNRLNSIEGVITEMVQMRSNAQITLDAGFRMKTRVPLSSVKSLGLGIGDKVYINFAVDALNVFADDKSESESLQN
jgi:ABC-type Fe3+/spermidine/putrescine transport system ATPase subunit